MAASETVAPPVAAPVDQVRGKARPPAPADDRFVLFVIGLTVLGAVLRIIVAHQSVFADELSTYWISATHSLGGVLSLLYSTGRIHHAEISPPLSFLASWLSTRLGRSPELLRLPALLAGTATIPLIYLLGARTVGRRAALVAAAVTTLSPFMIYYSAEARAYGLLMFLVVGAVLSMLMALDTGRTRYWVLYAACSAAAFYTHYTCTFVLAVALAWLLWTEPRLRRKALLANAGAALLVVPWIPGLIADLHSPTVRILSALSPFTANAVRIDLQHWALGYPYSVAGGLNVLPGVPALVLLALAAAVAIVGLARRVRDRGAGEVLRAMGSRRLLLIFALMLATPLGEVLGSTTGNHIIGVRDLAASWPFLALFGAALAIGAGARLGIAAAALGVVAIALGAPKMLDTRFDRPNYQAAADYVAAHAGPNDVVIDQTGALSPGPLTGFDVALRRPLRVIRARAPAERDHPFTVFDPFVTMQTAIARAVAAAHGGRIFIVGAPLPSQQLPSGYRLTSVRDYPAIQQTLVGVYSRTPAAGR